MLEASRTMLSHTGLEGALSHPLEVAFRPHPRDAMFGTSVLITGAAGSVGSGFARLVAAGQTGRLVLLDTDESGLFDLAAELEASRGPRRPKLEVVIGSVVSQPSVFRIFADSQPSFVIHAAAYKHVPLMEAHPEQAVETNVVGTLNVCQAAEKAGCSRVVVLSSDKAAAPTSVMGATKRLGERIVHAFARGSRTIFCAVRFGNVLWSRGSVLPTFERQIRQGGPLTLTHRDMQRFFVTLDDAVDLIIEAACLAESGETLVLEMGNPVKILDLADALIRLHGRQSGEDIEIREVGPRAGERLVEALAGPDECLAPTAHPRVLRAIPADQACPGRAELKRTIKHLMRLARLGGDDELISALFASAGFPAGSADDARSGRRRTPVPLPG
jgi:FlaA1/EpsC-like NDP-sugar epimerase